MKYKKYLTYSIVLFFGISIFNFSFDLKSNSSENYSLKNLNALQASAGEAGCDPTTNNPCRINTGQVILEGTGQPYVILP